MKSKLLAIAFLISTTAVHAQVPVDGEVMIGPALATIGGGETIERFYGVTIGVAANFHILEYGFGTIGLSLPPRLTIGERLDKDGIDFQSVHLPLGVMITAGDTNEGPGSIGGGVTIGYGVTVGQFTTNDVDVRPFINFDLSFGILERGSLKVRYSAILGNYVYPDRGAVNYHALMLIGSTSW